MYTIIIIINQIDQISTNQTSQKQILKHESNKMKPWWTWLKYNDDAEEDDAINDDDEDDDGDEDDDDIMMMMMMMKMMI